MPAETLGQFEQLILTAVTILGRENAYGMTIHESVEEMFKAKIVSVRRCVL